ncbi:hypothetical protein CHCC14820_3816 [Bacillus paralicheniformis]|uniref:Uncharacterized protein n=1 Tax=Bacillus paralicheniformis TaxID=1648923 RepID=A0A6I7TTC5_9BACI|nr:hypothetical protein SC10_B2orf04022 [Bacillus paralicheniformis]OLF91060.1 hypothetical protein B4121_2538 [Bacillus paralicheniformis]OLG05565.1 hypothetical protein B4123_3979 [Bacillus paralicheniformis]OLG08068.1 hypothetical protein B4125_2249 [Bacillus paralicheniformis]TWJ42660.1 hypothetical protein CHCC5027_4480 [Bacillus paralicheniformis]
MKYHVPSLSENLLLKTPEEDFTHFDDLLLLNELGKSLGQLMY